MEVRERGINVDTMKIDVQEYRIYSSSVGGYAELKFGVNLPSEWA